MALGPRRGPKRGRVDTTVEWQAHNRYIGAFERLRIGQMEKGKRRLEERVTHAPMLA